MRNGNNVLIKSKVQGPRSKVQDHDVPQTLDVGRRTFILAIETSSPQLSLAVGDDQAILSEYKGPLQWRHAEHLFEGIETVLKKAKGSLQALTGIVVDVGPGSFTGIRIGLACARAFGQALQIPVVGGNALETIAYEKLRNAECGMRNLDKPIKKDRPQIRNPKSEIRNDISVAIDALRDEVFSASYQFSKTGLLKCVQKPRRVFCSTLNVPLIGYGNKTLIETYPLATSLLALGRPRLVKATMDSYRTVLPLYLRDAAPVERQKK